MSDIINMTITTPPAVNQSITGFGIKGDTGATGAQGPKGDAGDPATNLVASVAGKTGAVTLDKTDVGLSNVDNLAPADMPVSTDTQTALNGKRTITTNTDSVYTTNGSGGQAVMEYSYGASEYTFPVRSSGGRIATGTPTANADAATKLYVDTADALKVNKAGDTMAGNLEISKGSGSTSIFLNNTAGGKRYEFYSDPNGRFGVWNTTDNIGSFRILPDSSAEMLVVGNNYIALAGQNTGPRIVSGTGFPEGVTTAPVGSIYIDRAATNGASSWIKKSGTGDTGWVVSVGDTGWRDIITLVNATYISTTPAFNSYLHIRIKDGIVFMRGRIIVTAAIGGSETHILTSSSGVPAEYRAPANVPAGFVGMVSTADLNTITTKLIRDCIINNGNFGTINLPLGGQYSFSTSWANTGGWPSTLPGTAV